MSYRQDERAVIKEALKTTLINIPPSLQKGYRTFQRKQKFQLLLQVNLLAQLAFLCYTLADWFMLPDIRSTSITLRVFYVFTMTGATLWLYKCSESLEHFDLLLPLSIAGAAALWFYLLNLSASPDVATYQYAAVVFIMLANLCTQFRFLPVMYISLLISTIIFYGLYQTTQQNLHELIIFSLAYVPVLVFSLYISWLSTYKSRQLYLHSLLNSYNSAVLERMAHTDVLTGLHNRRAFEKLAKTYFENNFSVPKTTHLLILDIDHFKQINDNYGHDTGDLVLQELATTARKEMRSSDVLARFGGEEFIVLLPQTSREEAIIIAERLRQKIEQSPVTLPHGEKIRFSISIGLAEFQPQRQNLQNLIKDADIALYQAKHCGRNQISVYGAETDTAPRQAENFSI